MHPLKRFLKRKNLLQRDFAAQIGISSNFLSRIMNYNSRPSFTLAQKMSEATSGTVQTHEFFLDNPDF